MHPRAHVQTISVGKKPKTERSAIFSLCGRGKGVGIKNTQRMNEMVRKAGITVTVSG
jgi:hypothetical protein